MFLMGEVPLYLWCVALGFCPALILRFHRFLFPSSLEIQFCFIGIPQLCISSSRLLIDEDFDAS